MPNTCSLCYNWNPDPLNPGTGFCQLYPPVPVFNGVRVLGMLPQTSATFGCGQFEALTPQNQPNQATGPVVNPVNYFLSTANPVVGQ